jgi:MtN3 and saliva related transmembrane protein
VIGYYAAGTFLFKSGRSLDSGARAGEHRFMDRDELVGALGIFAGLLTTASFLPQVIKAWRSRSTRDISLGMIATFCTGVFLWIVYGFLVGDFPVIAANVATFLLAAAILVLKLRYR